MESEILEKIAVDVIAIGIVDYLKASFDDRKEKPTKKDITVSVQTHISEIIKWSQRIQFFGMSSALMTDDCTIPLSLHSEPRKFRAKKNSSTKHEDSLLMDNENYILLGDPGSGKTTTLQRLARRIILSPPTSERDTYQYPIVLRLKEISPRPFAINKAIADILGLKYNIVAEVTTEFESNANIENVYITGTSELLTRAIPAILNTTKAILLIDGLDEVSTNSKNSIEDEIKQIAFKLNDSKIILTTRSGDYTTHLDGFNIIEICPLEEKQIIKIATFWLDNPSEFIKRVKAAPFYELTNRPLILTQLLLIFKKHGYLPEQPLEIYRKIINLFLEEWDAQRRVRRNSKYGNFSPERKMDFLAALSYHLTYKTKTKVFTENDLVNVYGEIYQSFNLPKDEAVEVAREIETHTGIIIETADNRFEFSHLSFQEYLCAYYLIRDPFAKFLGNYLNEYPAPLAIAVALSSNPSLWFAGLILNQSNFNALTVNSIDRFLSRILVEKPFFSPDTLLGVSFLKLFFFFDKLSDGVASSNLYSVVEANGVKKAIAEGLNWYAVDLDQSQRDRIYLRRRFHLLNYYDLETPDGGYFPKNLLIELVARYSIDMAELLKGQGLVRNIDVSIL